MTTKKIKLADIAKEVGCSTATVSYVLNNDPKQKINEETRRKILQVSSILGYQKNTIANALATGKSNCIGFYIGNSSFALATTDKFNFFSEIVEALALNGYHSILLAGSISEEVPFVDAIICIDFSEENFITVCSNNIIPVIGIDTHVHEPWIFEISSDISDIRERYYIDEDKIRSGGCEYCSGDYDQEITATVHRFHTSSEMTQKGIEVKYCPSCGRKLS